MTKKCILFIFLSVLLFSFSFADETQKSGIFCVSRTYPDKIGNELKIELANATAEKFFPVIVEFDKIIDSKSLYEKVKFMDKAERRDFTLTTLKDFTTSYQKDVMQYLKSMEQKGKVKNLSQLWLTNSIGMKTTKDVIENVKKHPTVALIWLDDKLTKPTCFIRGSTVSEGSSSNTDGREIVWNVSKINADQVWGLGYTGQNIIVGHIDTGVNYNHVDLADHLWDGGSSYPNHGYDFIDNDNDPMDTEGHGTHTAGTVAGDGTAGSQTGVAPDAQIMCLRAVPGDLTVLQNAINFALNHDADVITMSAGWDSAGAGGSWGYLSTQTRNMLNNCHSAGIIFSVSAGNGDNSGGHYTIPYDINIPANAPASWYGDAGHSAAMAVGATNQNNTIAYFSSHGATDWFFSPWYEYKYPPGLIKPDVSAPGGSPGIKSLYYASNTGYVSGWQGTSMACPHLTGAIALMLSKDPSLTPEEIDSIIETTCLDLGSSGRDNLYGAGLINALAAVNAVGVKEKPTHKHTFPTSLNVYPNPSVNTTTIDFSIAKPGRVIVSLYDVSGKKLLSMVNGVFNAGNHSIIWNRKNVNGNRVSEGIYFIRLKTSNHELRKKLILID